MHLITSIELRNFRGIHSLDLDLDECSVLIGENNVGKSSVLEALDTALGRRTGRGGRFADYDHHRADADRELPHDHETSVTVLFRESVGGDWPVEFAQALANVVQLDDSDSRLIIFRVKSAYDADTRTFETESTFLNVNRDPLPPSPASVRAIRDFAPAFYLQAERGAASDFRPGARFWSTFLRDPEMDPDVRKTLEAELRSVNAKVLEATPSLNALRAMLDRAGELVMLRDREPVALEPLPSRIPEALRKTEVRLTTPFEASIPLAGHGGGTQNVAVLFLFQAYLTAILAQDFEASAAPLLAIEEPEAHLHPSATRATWSILADLSGQTVVATHSGDLLARAPLSAVRRLTRESGKVTAHRLRDGTLSEGEQRKVDFHVRKARAELLFARVWLLGEGESEYWVFQGAADGLGWDLEQDGVRTVDGYAQSGGPAPLVKLANDLGISWHVVADGDPAGEQYAEVARGHLDSRQETDHITLLQDNTMEHLLCRTGFGDLYEAVLTGPERSQLEAHPDDNHYWEDVLDPIRGKRKVQVAVEAARLMQSGDRPVPGPLSDILSKATALAQS